MNEYAFDCKLFCALRVKAKTQRDAEAMVREHIEGASANFGCWTDGSPIIAEVSVDGELDLYEKNGEPR